MLALALTTLFAVDAVLAAPRTWYPPAAPLVVDVAADAGELELTLTDFQGRRTQDRIAAPATAGTQVDLRQIFPTLPPGTYLLSAQRPGSLEPLGTPLVVQVRQDTRAGAPLTPLVVKVEPLRYATVETDVGPMTWTFYYDAAPDTVANFLALAQGGFYDGLTFHRVVANFVAQGGDPLGSGVGGPGYRVEAELSARPFARGVVGMARQGDPLERDGAQPRPEFVNSAGSQFFVVLNDDGGRALDGKYAAFAQLVGDLAPLDKLAASELEDQETGRPRTPPVIRKVTVRDVTATDNPYTRVEQAGPATQPEDVRAETGASGGPTPAPSNATTP